MITIVDYSAGNLKSVQRACSEVGVEAVITSNPVDVKKAEKIIFPGIGAAPSAMEYMQKLGLGDALKGAFNEGTPILGICLGAQIILDSSEEGEQECLGLVSGKTIRFKFKDNKLKIPHIGWNEVSVAQEHPVLKDIEAGDEFYFDHAFYPQPTRKEDIYAVTDYGIDFCSAVGYKNLFAVQFHPEKSGRLGLRMLERFAAWDGNI